MLPKSSHPNAFVPAKVVRSSDFCNHADERAETDVDPSKTKPTTLTQFLSSITRKKAPEMKELTAHELVDRWGWLNTGRFFICLAGAVCGAFAVCNEDLSFFE